MTHDDQLSTNSELDWQAFRYIAGEMTESEAAAFESQLAEDQVVREAVARAVELTQTVSACHFDLDDEALRLPDRGRRVGWWSAAIWASIGAAASLLLVVGLQGLWKDEATLVDVSPSQSDLRDSTGELAEVWSETREPLVFDSELADENLLEAGDDLHFGHSDNGALDLVGDEYEAGQLITPDWMLAALEDLVNDDLENGEGVQTP